MQIVSTYEIAQRLDVAASTVHKWRQRDIGFPQPYATLRIGPVWDWATVDEWATARR